MPDAALLINDELAAMLEGGVSISVGSCSFDKVPSVVRALACRISSDRRHITVLVSDKQAAAVLADIRRTGQIAVGFSQPSTHRTMQFKGAHAVIGPLRDGDEALLRNYVDTFINDVSPLGYDARLLHALMSSSVEDMISITFAPTSAFTQTPGPHAGEPFKGAA